MVESGPFIEYACMPYVRCDYVAVMVVLALTASAIVLLVRSLRRK